MVAYIGMDVHKESYTLCCFTQYANEPFFHQTMDSNINHVLRYLERVRTSIKEKTGEEVEFLCGYEAGCLGYSLYKQLLRVDVACVILAPSTMPSIANKGVKTDKRDASNIAQCLAFGTYSPVCVPTVEDEAVKEYIRMREDNKKLLKTVKQQIHALLLRHGYSYGEGSYWTVKHISWLKRVKLDNSVLQETLDEYLINLNYLCDKIERLDKRIEDFAKTDSYQEKVKKLSCFLGVKTVTALSVIVEIGDFHRFAKAEQMASFLGLVPGESSSGAKVARLGITKAGNSHIRRLLVESAQSYTRGRVGNKSVTIKRRQAGNTPDVIAYADRANERLRRKFYRMTLQRGTKRNVAITAIARELSCFMWGMMTGNIA